MDPPLPMPGNLFVLESLLRASSHHSAAWCPGDGRQEWGSLLALGARDQGFLRLNPCCSPMLPRKPRHQPLSMGQGWGCAQMCRLPGLNMALQCPCSGTPGVLLRTGDTPGRGSVPGEPGTARTQKHCSRSPAGRAQGTAWRKRTPWQRGHIRPEKWWVGDAAQQTGHTSTPLRELCQGLAGWLSGRPD